MATPDMDVDLAFRFFHPNLHTIVTEETRAGTPPTQAWLFNLHKIIIRQAPQIKELSFLGLGRLSASQARSLVQATLALRRLEILEIRDVQDLPSLLHVLSHHVTIKNIHITSSEFNNLHALPEFEWNPEHKAALFPSLEKLIVSLPFGRDTIAMLADIRESGSLTELNLMNGRDTGEKKPGSLHQLCEAVSRHEALRSLALHQLAQSSLGLDHFRPLLQCRMLGSLKIHTSEAFFLRDFELLDVATALPRLHTLAIIPTDVYLTKAQATSLSLLSIVHCLAKCPNLSSLAILVDARRQVPDVAAVSSACIPPRSELELVMVYSPIGPSGHAKIASFLRSLGVQERIRIRTESSGSEALVQMALKVGYVQRWEAVHKLLGLVEVDCAKEVVRKPKNTSSGSDKKRRFLEAISSGV